MEYILVVDDNKNMQFILTNILHEKGYEVCCVGNGNKAITEIKNKIPDLVLLDIRLPGKNGIEVLEKLRELDKELLVIMITAYGDVKSAVKAIKLGAYDYVTKPFDNEELLNIIKNALKTKNLSEEIKILKRKLYDQTEIKKVMGDSPQINKVIKQVNLVSPTNISVIIEGKSGTGKEVIANMIHQRSQRNGRPFIAVDCGAIPDTLVESELFGYEKGAFTGAIISRKGEFELADGGTLFLDEISNLPIGAQAKLLRVIQERKLRRVGGTKSIKIDVRIIVATNINLADSVGEGKFRDDLYHRISEFIIILPLLRERKDDIPILAREFLAEANKELGKNIEGFSPEAIMKLLDYEWPGNVRELKHIIKKAVLLSEKDNIKPEILEFDTAQKSSFIQNELSINYIQKILYEGCSLSDIISNINQETERKIIKEILVEVKYNKSKAAKILGIDRNTLYSKIRKLNIL
jgi:two-component system response regulator AtoC